jgi:peptidoglycan/LPS O-acetylase OafA/YrhL
VAYGGETANTLVFLPDDGMTPHVEERLTRGFDFFAPLMCFSCDQPDYSRAFGVHGVQQVSSQADQSRVPALDLLRLIAVGAVILYHFGFWGPASHGLPQVAIPSLGLIAQYGFLGVPVFFAISGFVIAYSAEGRTPVSFIIARFSRIYPTFIFCMTLTCIVIMLWGSGNFEVKAPQWFANLFIAAPLFGQSYIDTSYWSLVIEVIFYGWVAGFIALGLFPRKIDAIILVWLAITFMNELTVGAPVIEKLFITDDSGFFAVGLLIYQHYRGRRDLSGYGMLALAFGTAAFQSVHKLERLSLHTGATFDPHITATICIVSLGVVFLATRVTWLPLPPMMVLAAGGVTYPLYLLHMQLGYVIFTAIAPVEYAVLCTIAIIAGAVILAWGVWNFVERPAHQWTKYLLTNFAERLGWQLNLRASTAA